MSKNIETPEGLDYQSATALSIHSYLRHKPRDSPVNEILERMSATEVIIR